MELVKPYKQALASARGFQSVDKDPDSVAYGQLRRYFHWYYFEELHAFAPSKFIGYVGTSVKSYKSAGTGSDTTSALRKLFVQVPRPSQQFDSLAEHLLDWLSQLGASLSAKTLVGSGGIHVRRGSAPTQRSQSGSTAQRTRSETVYFEGDPFEVRQTRYERNLKARAACLKYYGYSCQACPIDFEKRYGKIGREFIHVHHIEPLSVIGSSREVNPIEDLIPLCPNCHAMIHKLPHPQTLAALRRRLR